MREFIKAIIENKILDFNYLQYSTIFAKGDYDTYYLFFLLENKEQLIELKNKTADIYNAIKQNKQIYEIHMDKNITCIFCLCVEEDEYYEMEKGNKISDLNKLICLIEEDLNYFKKNILIYTEEMNKFAEENIGKFASVCQEYITDNNFQEYKKSNKKNYQYDFLMNLFIKLPFLKFQKYQIRDSKQYKTMESFIEKECTIKGINKKYIDNISEEIKDKLENEEVLYQWLDSLAEKEQVKEVVKHEN